MEKIFENGMNGKKFAGFVTPSVIMLIFMAMYYVVDAIFVANFVGPKALAAMNIIYPICGIGWGISVMLAAGSSAIVAIKMGEGKKQEAKEKFSLICIVSIVLGLIFVTLGLTFTTELVSILGSTPGLHDYCVDYIWVILLGVPGVFLGVLLEYFIRVDGRAGFTLFLYVLGGIVNIVLDYVFIVELNFGIAGAAWATIAGQYAVMIVGIGYFVTQKTNLKFVLPKWDFKYIWSSMLNGSSEMVSESSVAITLILFNYITLRIAGETGLTALSVVMEAQYLLVSLHLGFITGVSPLISYFYGAKNYTIVNKCLGYCERFIWVASLGMTVLAVVGAPWIASIFIDAGTAAHDMAVTGVRFLSVACLFTGLNVFASGFFTAYANGVISAMISLSRGLIVVIIGAIILPLLFGLNGVWMVPAFAEIVTFALSIYMIRKYKKKYHYKFFAKNKYHYKFFAKNKALQ
ncbi:MAG: MATE family efflux transporter [Anaerovorax sp.]